MRTHAGEQPVFLAVVLHPGASGALEAAAELVPVL